jgi:2-polyprenyl-3-methyl-5-hydroxy-6-metoxy-1,4-benzoquinol methylase
MDWARALPPTRGLTLRQSLSSELVAEGERFTVVLSNHVLHHLDGREFGALLADSERLLAPGGIAVHGDIERSLFAYAGFWLGTLPFAANLLAETYIRPDGLTSIRRSHTAAELARALPAGWRVRRAFPSRLEVITGPDAAR